MLGLFIEPQSAMNTLAPQRRISQKFSFRKPFLTTWAAKICDTHYDKEKSKENRTANRNKGDFSDLRRKDFVTVYDDKSWYNSNERKKYTKTYSI
jgi:hypothetical protein